ncbi:MAG: M28 family peptidase [Melioribacteraceae bacterium]|nr:M28 family peptidase [Melioribacteraceae bacterium]
MKTFFILSLIFCYTITAQGISVLKENSKESFKRNLTFLGSDLFEGRGTGTAGGNLAAKYLALEFEQLKLSPIGQNNTYYQYIPMHGGIALETSELNIFTFTKIEKLKLKEDYLLYVSGEQTFVPKPLEIIFAGYGIIAPEFDYNDYQSIQVEGKIIAYLDGEPKSDNPEYFAGDEATVYSSPEAKQRTALARGARGSILIPNLADSKYYSWEETILLFSFENITLAYTPSNSLSILLNPERAEVLFKDSGFNYKQILEMHSSNQMKSFPLKSSLSFRGEFKERDFVASNIAGMIPGSDSKLKDSYIIVSAHYDHLGIGPSIRGDSIYNGVYDNAMGVSALIEIARTFSKDEYKPKRSIIFLLLTGEEKGLLGARYYTDNPIIPLYKTIANVNIDGIAAFDKFKSVVGVGSNFSTLEEFLIKSNTEMGLEIDSIPREFASEEAFTQSDQFAFALAGIPSILILEGTEYEMITSEEGINKMIEYYFDYYHSPFDDLSREINYDASMQHIQVLLNFIRLLSNSSEIPEWKKGSPFINQRLRTIAEKR